MASNTPPKSPKKNKYKLKEFGISNEPSLEAGSQDVTPSIREVLSNLKIEIIHMDDLDIEFDIVNIGAPIVNAIRRILIAEIPTMAIDKVNMYNNTSIIPDEVLAHRIGLVPINIDPRPFQRYFAGDGVENKDDTLKFELKVKCSRNTNISKEIPVSDEMSCSNSKIYSRDLKFINNGVYEDVRPVDEDILLAVLKPGHEIDLEAFCMKGIGREHAKFSPVAVASYRLMPVMELKADIEGDSAHTLSKIFPGVIKVSKKKGKEVAEVINQRKIVCHRNIFFHDDLKDKVELSKIEDHFIFTVESVGALKPDLLVLEAINILKDKCQKFLKELKSQNIR